MTGGQKRTDSHHRDGVVIEDSRNIFGGELVCCVADEEASLSNGTVADDDAPRSTRSGSAQMMQLMVDKMITRSEMGRRWLSNPERRRATAMMTPTRQEKVEAQRGPRRQNGEEHT